MSRSRVPESAWSPATDLERRAIEALRPGRVVYVPGTAHKRFARDVQGVTRLTNAQRELIWRMVHRYRRQVRDAELVRFASDYLQPRETSE